MKKKWTNLNWYSKKHYICTHKGNAEIDTLPCQIPNNSIKKYINLIL